MTIWQESRLGRLKVLPLALAVMGLGLGLGPGASPSLAAGPADIPEWLQAHVGTGEGEIAPVVLERARALHQRKLREGAVQNGCYFAMDATRPSTSPDGALGRRFYIICEAEQSFRAVSSGYGNGRKLSQANFSNGRDCAKNFSNAEGSKLTMGGAYVTAEAVTSFKGYTSLSGEKTPFLRTFLQFEGEGETANARERVIGGHPAVYVKWQCRYKNPDSPYADKEGFVPYGSVVDYTGGRSNGCTSWSRSDAEAILAIVKDSPTTLYIYPESGDIAAVARAVAGRKSLADAGLYWNAACLSAIGAPKFWPKRDLEPIIDKWRASLPHVTPRPLPVCR